MLIQVNIRDVYDAGTNDYNNGNAITSGNAATLVNSGVKLEFFQGTDGTNYLPFRNVSSHFWSSFWSNTSSTAHGFLGNVPPLGKLPCIGSNISDKAAYEGGAYLHSDWLAFSPANGSYSDNTKKLFIKVTPLTNCTIKNYTLWYQASSSGSVRFTTGNYDGSSASENQHISQYITGQATSAPGSWVYEGTVDDYERVKKYTNSGDITEDDYLYIHIDDYYGYDAASDTGTIKLVLEVEVPLSPPTVSFPSSPVEEDSATVDVVLGSGASQWEYSVDSGVNWTSGGTSDGSFTLSSGTYGDNSIRVRNGDGTNLWIEEKNSSEIVVQKKFVPADALAQTSGLETYIESLSEVQTLKEVHELKYNTLQEYGGTNFWAYYSYVAASNGVIAYKTKLFTFSPDTNGWTESLFNGGPIESTNSASISSNGLSAGEAVGYTDIFHGFVPFQMNTSTASLASLKTIYNGSAFTTNNLSDPNATYNYNVDFYNAGYGNKYRFNGGEYNDSSNPVLTFIRGSTYNLTINAGGHPFYFQTTPDNGGQHQSANNYNDGVTGNGNDNGVITFIVPEDAPSTLYYRCGIHNGMGNTINIVSVTNNVYNIWHDERDVFDRNYSNTTRVADVWIYVLTDYSDSQSNVLYETRKVKYTITRTITNGNATYAYAWTIPTDETTAVAPTINNTQYTNIPDVSNYVLSYFNFDAYMITDRQSMTSLKSVYKTYFTDNKQISFVNELWYDKSNLTPEDTTYDVLYNDTKLTENNIDLKLYGIKDDIDGDGYLSNECWTRIDIRYLKNTREWSIIGNDLYVFAQNSGIADNLGNSNFHQILSNILYDIPGKVSALKTTYNNVYSTTVGTIIKLWSSTSQKNILPCFIYFTVPNYTYYTTAIYDRVINGWSFNNANESFNNQLAISLIHSEFTIVELENKLQEIKIQYETVSDNVLVNAHNIWYNNSTVNNTVINGKLYHSYNTNNETSKLYFGIVDLSYNMESNTENYLVAIETLSSKNYDYNGNDLVGYTSIPSYNIDVSFNIDVLNPIMINNINVRNQFDASFAEIDSTKNIEKIHTLWLNGVNVNNNINYVNLSTDLWIYYSYSSGNNTLYESRNMSYNLQFNVWDLNGNNNIETGTIISSGLENTDLSNYVKVYESLPVIPPFSTATAKSVSSLSELKNVYATHQSINSNVLEILNIWYRTADSQNAIVKCIVYLSISSFNNNELIQNYKTFIINYDNTLFNWVIPTTFQSEDSTLNDNKIIELITPESVSEYFLFYSVPSGPVISTTKDNVLINNEVHFDFPIGTILMCYMQTITLGDAFLLCNGDPYDKGTYPELCDVLNYKYGGSGNSFNVPDLEDRFPLGANTVSEEGLGSAEDKHSNVHERKGGSWTIDSDQFIHNHASPYHKYINALSWRGGDMDDTSPFSPAHWHNGSNGTGTISDDSTGVHKPRYFAVQYMIYTGRGRIG